MTTVIITERQNALGARAHDRFLFVEVEDHHKAIVAGGNEVAALLDRGRIHWKEDDGSTIYAYRIDEEAPLPDAKADRDCGYRIRPGALEEITPELLAHNRAKYPASASTHALAAWWDLEDILRETLPCEGKGPLRELEPCDFPHLGLTDLGELLRGLSAEFGATTLIEEGAPLEEDEHTERDECIDAFELAAIKCGQIQGERDWADSAYRAAYDAWDAKFWSKQKATPVAPAPAQLKPTPEPALRYVPVGDLQYAEVTPPTFIVSQIVPCGVVTLLSGHGGTGKSTLALTIGAHVAAHTWAWSDLALKSGRVVYVSLEDDGDVVRFRLKKIADSYGLDTLSIRRNMLVLDGTDCETGLAVELSQNGRKVLGFTQAMQEAISACENARLIIIDNVSDAFDANENDRPLVRAFVKRLTKIARNNDAGLILLAHVDKAGVRNGSNGNTFSGSTAWHNSARSRLALHDSGDELIELRHEKSNFGPKARTLNFRFNDRGIPMPADSTLNTAATTAEEDALLLRCIERAAGTGEPIAANRAGPGNTHSRMVTLPGFPLSLKPKNRFWSAIDRLFDAGRIARVEYTDSRRKTKAKWTVAPVAQVAPVLDN